MNDLTDFQRSFLKEHAVYKEDCKEGYWKPIYGYIYIFLFVTLTGALFCNYFFPNDMWNFYLKIGVYFIFFFHVGLLLILSTIFGAEAGLIYTLTYQSPYSNEVRDFHRHMKERLHHEYTDGKVKTKKLLLRGLHLVYVVALFLQQWWVFALFEIGVIIITQLWWGWIHSSNYFYVANLNPTKVAILESDEKEEMFKPSMN